MSSSSTPPPSSPRLDIIFGSVCRTLLITVVIFYFAFIFLSNQYPNCPASDFFSPFTKRAPPTEIADLEKPSTNTPTNLSHLVFGLVGSEKAYHHRKNYIESWWRPNITRGVIFLDTAPTGDLLPWSPASPPYKVSDDLATLLNKKNTLHHRIFHAIMEVYREDHENLRWMVMGDDDSVFFVDNIVDVLSQYDHTKYYYMGGHSEFISSNYHFSFSQGFGGAGIIMSYPLAKAMAAELENCLRRYAYLNAADRTTMTCAADIGVSLTALKGIHQIDLHGDISGLLSSHPKYPLMSLHHLDMVSPIFPSMNRVESTRHLMKAAAADHSRLLQQTICHHRPSNWTFSVSWGYSAQVYEKIMPRSWLQQPIETFRPWYGKPRPPLYMFNTRYPSNDPCEAPHSFFYESIARTLDGEILTMFSRAGPRNLPACSWSGNHSADSVARIHVYSSAAKRLQIDRSECCDVVRVEGDKAEVKFRECTAGEVIA